MPRQTFQQPSRRRKDDDAYSDDQGWAPTHDFQRSSDISREAQQTADNITNVLGEQEAGAAVADTSSEGNDKTPVSSDDLAEKETPPDRSGFSAADDMREKLGKGYTGKNSRKSNILSNLYSSDSKLKKKMAIAGAAAGTSIIGGIIVFLALLPLKIDMLIQNIDQTFGAASNQALEKETDNLFSDWVKNSLLPALNTGTCKRTIDPGCVPVDSGTGPIKKLYAGWNKNRLDKKLATDYGITIGRGSNGHPVMNIHGGSVDLTELQSGQRSLFDLAGTKSVTSGEIKSQINSALDGETKWKEVYKRYFITKKIDKTFGTYTHCLVLCDSREKVKLKLSDAKLGAKLWIANRVIAPRSTGAAALVTCMLDPTSCSTDISFDSGNVEDSNSPERSKAQQVADSLVANYLESHTLNDLAKLAENASDINRLGFSGYATKLIAQQIAGHFSGDAASAATGETLDKAIPIFGWIQLGLGVTTLASSAPGIIKTLSYATNATAAAQLYTTYKTADDEMHTGNTDAEAFGTLNDALSASSDLGSTHSDMTSTPVYNYTMGSSYGTGFSNAASIFGATTADSSDTSYKCNDGKGVPSGQLTCPEENFSKTNVAALDALANSGTLNTISHIAGPIASILNKPGQFIGGIVSSIPGVSQVMSAISSFASGFLSDIAQTLLPNPFQDLSGGRTGDMVIAGGDVTQNGACYQNLGCAKVSAQTAATIQNQQRQENQQQFESQPMFARMFSTDTPYSLVSRLAVAMPTNLSSGVENGVASLTSNPVGSLFSGISSVFTGKKAFAAVTAAEDPFGVTQMAYPTVPAHPADFWNENCSTPAPGNQYGYYNDTTGTWDASNWYNSSQYQEQDPNTGQSVATKTNPCMLIAASIGAAGGLDDTSLLPHDETQTPPTTAAASFTVAAYNMCQEQNHPQGCPTTNVTQKAQDISNVIQGKSGISGNTTPFGIISAQEVSPQTQSAVLADLPNYQSFPQQVPGSQGWAVFWDKTQFSLVGSGQYLPNVYNNVACLMTANSKCSMPGAPWVELQTSTGQDIYVISVHSPNNQNNGNTSIRNHNASVVLDWAKSHDNGNNIVIIGGDFNDTPDGTSPSSDYCVLTKDGSLQHALDMQNGKSGACPSSGMSIEKIFASTANDTSASDWHTLGQGVDSNLTGTDHSPSWSTITPGTSETTSKSGKLVVGEYNILNAPKYAHPGFVNKGQSDDDRAKLEAQIVQGTAGPSHQPFDVLITNEETDSMYKGQKKYLTDYSSQRKGEYAIFWKTSEFTEEDHGTSPEWSSNGSWVDAPWVKLQTVADGQTIVASPIHYSSFPQYGYSDSNIKKAANDTLDWVKQQNDGKSIVIFGGDLGTHLQIPAKIFNSSGLVNNSYYLAKGKKATGSDTAPGGADQIYVTPINGLTASDWNNPSRTGIIMQSSDHSPTWVTLQYGGSD